MYEKGFIYKGLRVSLYCPHCSTPISNFEVAMDADNYKDVTESATTYKYRVKNHESSIKQEIENLLKNDKRLPGVGHRVYKDLDPRAQLIMNTARENGIGEEYIQIVNELRYELEKQSGKSLPVNIDGAIAAVFCGFGLKPESAIAIFIVARAPGLCAHFINNSH